MSDYMRPVAPVPRVVPRTARTYREPTVGMYWLTLWKERT